jgi:hypothetical protein
MTTSVPTRDTVRQWAELSDDGRYRYLLGRQWDESLPKCVFLMLNPSTADATENDPTIRRCIRFARDLGCGSLLVGNPYAFRATDPRDLFKSIEPTGGDRNDAVLARLLSGDGIVIAGWGNHAKPDRVADVVRLPGADRIVALGLTKSGAPRHPLYVLASTTPSPWRPPV